MSRLWNANFIAWWQVRMEGRFLATFYSKSQILLAYKGKSAPILLLTVSAWLAVFVNMLCLISVNSNVTTLYSGCFCLQTGFFPFFFYSPCRHISWVVHLPWCRMRVYYMLFLHLRIKSSLVNWLDTSCFGLFAHFKRYPVSSHNEGGGGGGEGRACVRQVVSSPLPGPGTSSVSFSSSPAFLCRFCGSHLHFFTFFPAWDIRGLIISKKCDI